MSGSQEGAGFGSPPRAGWIREEEAATLAEDLRKTKMERDRLLGFVIQTCLHCGAVTAPDEALAEFVDASVAVWREIDRLEAGGNYPGIDQGTDLRQRERAAWNAYREELDG